MGARWRWVHRPRGTRLVVLMILVVDHLRGSKRGTREFFEPFERIAIGRHPDSDVSFDPKRDIDASTRHAEFVWNAGARVGCLADLGSSNGTWIGGAKVAKYNLPLGESLDVEFGRGGPVLRLWIGENGKDDLPPRRRMRGLRRFLPW